MCAVEGGMTHGELVEAIAKDTGVAEGKVRQILRSLQQNVVKTVTSGEGVTLHGFGRFERKTQSKRTVPGFDGKRIEVPEKKVLKFRAFNPAVGS